MSFSDLQKDKSPSQFRRVPIQHSEDRAVPVQVQAASNTTLIGLEFQKVLAVQPASRSVSGRISHAQ